MDWLITPGWMDGWMASFDFVILAVEILCQPQDYSCVVCLSLRFPVASVSVTHSLINYYRVPEVQFTAYSLSPV